MIFATSYRTRRWWRVRPGMLVVLAVLLLSLIAVAFCFDTAACAWMKEFRSKSWKEWAAIVTELGDWPVMAGIVAVLLLVARQFAQRRWVKILSLMLVASMLAGVAANVIRAVSGRARPNAQVEKGWHGLKDGEAWTVGRHRYSSFPSAHTTVAAAFMAPLVLLGGRMLLPALSIVLLVGWSRFYLMMHHPSDILVGATLGWSVGWFLCHAATVRLWFWRFAGTLCGLRSVAPPSDDMGAAPEIEAA